jgi:hypothetical protein
MDRRDVLLSFMGDTRTGIQYSTDMGGATIASPGAVPIF